MEFDHLSTLITIVLGLGITNLLTGTAVLIRTRSEATIYWPVTVWMGTLFLALVQNWWTMFALRQVTHWNFVAFFIVLMQPVLLFLPTALIIPNPFGGLPVDLRADFYRHTRWFFACLAAEACASLAKDVMLYGKLPRAGNLAAHIGFLTFAAIGCWTRNERVHKTGALLALFGYIFYTIRLFLRLEGM
ncbi:MAG TPA: hypothetical protein VEI03_14805 [Stellaceae bacterium]|nr:hypothetical protein [Stellaceae bacterium]